MLNYFTATQPFSFSGVRALSPCPQRSTSRPPPHGVGATYQGKTQYAIAQEKDLGKGTFGSVKLVKDTKSGKLYAMKIINKAAVKKMVGDENIKRELGLQGKLNHRNILTLHEHFEDKNDHFMILEYCAKGNLYQLLQKKKTLAEKEAFTIFHQICQGVDYLHSQGIVHRDLKPENILFYENGTVKICDYNWAKKLPPGQKCDPVLCGTTEYMPPEVVAKQVHDCKVDVWSLGIMLYEFFHGEIPFKGANKKEKIAAILCNTLKMNQDLPLDVQILIHQLLSRVVDQRPSIQQVYKSRWISRMLKEHMLYSTPPRPQTTYTKTRAVQSDRLSFFSSNSTAISKSRYQSNDKRNATPNYDFKALTQWETRLKQSLIQTVKAVPVKALGASNVSNVFGASEEKQPLKRATSYQRTPAFTPFKSALSQRIND